MTLSQDKGITKNLVIQKPEQGLTVATIAREKILLGIILETPNQIKKIPSCTPQHFINYQYREIFKAIQHIVLLGHSPDLPSVAEELNARGKNDIIQGFLIDLTTQTHLSHSIERIFEDLHRAYLKRHAKELATKLLNDLDTNEDLQTILTEFQYKTKTLGSSGDMFEPFRMTLDYVANESAEIATFQDEVILRKGNILSIVSGEGVGKSRLMSTIVSSRYSDCDSFGFKLHIENNEIILHIDTEQERNEVFKGMNRIIKRTGNPKNLKSGNVLRNYELLSFVTVPSIKEKYTQLFNMIEKYNDKIGLLILDGSTDFVNNINDIQESQDFLARLGSYMSAYDFATIATIHKNPADKEGKPRGHIGGELLRKSGSVLRIAKTQHTHQFFDYSQEEQVRTLTTDFIYGKNRFGKDSGLNAYFAWNDQERMFTSCDIDGVEPRTVSTSQKMQSDFYHTFSALEFEPTGYTDLVIKYVEISGKKESTAKRHITAAVKKDILIKSDIGLYSIKNDTPF